MAEVQTLDGAILWLWKKHNEVNIRLAGAPSEDPMFPKVAWPTADGCPVCHEEIKGLHTWKEEEVLRFLKSHYSVDNISYKYSGYESQIHKAVNEVVKGNGKKGKEKGPPQLMHSQKEPNIDAQNIDQNSRNGALVKRERTDLLDQNMERQELDSYRKEVKHISFLGVGFSRMDMSLCILLYAASSFFLMIMYFYFQMRSKRWKTKFTRPCV